VTVFAIQQKLVASAMREDDKMACVGKNVAREKLASAQAAQ